jgi:hypothetical protein
MLAAGYGETAVVEVLPPPALTFAATTAASPR